MGGKNAVLLVAICALVSVSSVSAGIGFGGCPEKNVTQNFDIAKYTGRWFEISSFGAFFEFGGKCIQAVYTAEDDKVGVMNAMVNKLTQKISFIEGSAVPEDSASGEAKLLVTFPMPWGNRTGPYWVLDTDYENYSLVYACSDFGNVHYDFGWVLSKKPTLTPEMKEKVESILKANDLNPQRYWPTIQNCGTIDCSTKPCTITPFDKAS